MDLLIQDKYNLYNFNKINIVLGKNGCGKSTMFRVIEKNIKSATQSFEIGHTKYITPERGGTLVYDAGIENNLVGNPNYLVNSRHKNQSQNFRQESVAQYKKLENIVLREIEKERRKDFDYSFDIFIEKLNSLLDNIKIIREGSFFKICSNKENPLTPEQISSGESELISMGIECLIFSKECVKNKENFLFLDEPDVHLHPDLQVRLIRFIEDLVAQNNFNVFIATHSTAILGALTKISDAHIEFMSYGQKNLNFKKISDCYRKMLPIFGAHPLSNIFNEAPILLVEGEDDERIWQQAVRSSAGKLKIYPCAVDGIKRMNEFEQEANQILESVYDAAKGYSLRDRDEGKEDIEDLSLIVRMKLSCRSAENLILTDEVLKSLKTSWSQLRKGIDNWIQKNASHVHYDIMVRFKSEGYDRKNFDLKEIRNDLMHIIGSPRPWEVAVGQCIAGLAMATDPIFYDKEGTLSSYLGRKIVESIF